MIIICIQGGSECICVYVMLFRKKESLKQLNQVAVVSVKSQRQPDFVRIAANVPLRQEKSASDYFASTGNTLKIRARFQPLDLQTVLAHHVQRLGMFDEAPFCLKHHFLA